MKKELTTQEQIEALMDLKKQLRVRADRNPLQNTIKMFETVFKEKSIDIGTKLMIEAGKEEVEMMLAITEKYIIKADEEIKLLLTKLNQEVNS